jgi:hypothetical protein
MKFEELIIYEPRVISLVSDCHYLSMIPNEILKNEIFEKIIYPKIGKLVGWGCDDEALKDCEIYDMVRETLKKLMGV